MRAVALPWLLCVSIAAVAQTSQPHRWTKFVPVEGQPEPVPVEWVATPEGRFAHSIRIPNPVPKDSGYRPGMTSQQYFEHLCKTEAGEFIYKTVDNVEGFYFMRPPKRPTDRDLMDRYRLEAPEIERTFQLRRDLPEDRARIFVNPPWASFRYIEEKRASSTTPSAPYTRASGYRQDVTHMRVESTADLVSRFALTWRGIKRPNDRELSVAGSEWIVLSLTSGEVVSVFRHFTMGGRSQKAANGIWWLNAVNCPGGSDKNVRSSRIYSMVSKVLQPRTADQ